MGLNQRWTDSQAGIAAWFDDTYRRRGLRYLRPPRAYPIFVQLLGGQPGERLLDVACGPGLLLRAAVERGLEAFGLDVSGEAVAMARRAVPAATVVQGSAEELPYPDASFDCVTCLGSIERFLDREKALREIARVLRPGGRFCVLGRGAKTVSWQLWRQLLGRREVESHQDALTLSQWRALFERTGFAVQDTLPDQWPHQRLWQLLPGQMPTPTRPERLRRGSLALEYCNEWIFVLRHASGPGAPQLT